MLRTVRAAVATAWRAASLHEFGLGPPIRTRFAFARHIGQRWGTFWSPFSAKKRCSPPEKMKLSPQSRQVRVRSSYTASVLRLRVARLPFRSPTTPVLLRAGLDPEP